MLIVRVCFFSFNERASFPRRRHFLARAPLPPPTPSPPTRVMQSPSRAETRCRGRRRCHQVAPLPHPPFSRIGGARHSGGAGGGRHLRCQDQRGVLGEGASCDAVESRGDVAAPWGWGAVHAPPPSSAPVHACGVTLAVGRSSRWRGQPPRIVRS